MTSTNNQTIYDLLKSTEDLFKSNRDRYSLADHAAASHHLVDGIIPSDITVIGGEGALLNTNRGPMIDLQAQTMNAILGQGDPWVKFQQIGFLASNHPTFHSSRLGSNVYFGLAQRLSQLGIGGIDDPVINHRLCNGSDGTEQAIIAACANKPDGEFIVAFDGSHHGQSLSTIMVSGRLQDFTFLAPKSNTVFLPLPSNNNPFDGDQRLSDEETVVLEKLTELVPQAYAVILEPIQVNSGVRSFSGNFLKATQEICNNAKTCLIFDEVQTGFGWLGKLSAADVHGVTPDSIVLSKALTSGNGPLAATISRRQFDRVHREIASRTNGANIHSLVGAHATLDRLMGVGDASLIPEPFQDALREELTVGLLSLVPERAQILAGHLAQLAQDHPSIVRAVKGYGFIRGVDIMDQDGNPDSRLAAEVVKRCLETGVFFRAAGSTLIIKPPIVITPSQMATAFGIVNDALNHVSKRPPNGSVSSTNAKGKIHAADIRL